MDELHRETRRLALTTRHQLESLESAANSHLSPLASFDLRQSYSSNIHLLSNHILKLKHLLSLEPSHRKNYWHARLHDLDDQVNELRQGELRCGVKFKEVERELLLRREDDMMRRRGGKGGAGEVVVDFGAVEEGESLKRSGRGVSGVLESGMGVLELLRGQRGQLEGARGRLVGLLKGVGASRGVIRQIERRDKADVLLMYVGMTILVAIVLVVYGIRKLVS